jgi:hypothetical protein
MKMPTIPLSGAQVKLHNMYEGDLVLKEFFQGFDESAVFFHGADGYPDVVR